MTHMRLSTQCGANCKTYYMGVKYFKFSICELSANYVLRIICSTVSRSENRSMEKRWLTFAVFLTLILGSVAEQCPLLHAPEGTNRLYSCAGQYNCTRKVCRNS